jgi:hypothetical protein
VFEKALIYRAGLEKKVDIGLLAETLFFYSNTHLLLDRSSVVALAKKIPRNVLLELFDRDLIRLSYIREGFGVLSSGIPIAHNFGAFKLAGNASGKKIKNYQDEITEALERELGNSYETRKFAKAISDRVALHRFRGIPEKEKIIPDLMRADMEDVGFVERAVQVSLSHLIPGFDQNTKFHFRVFKTSEQSYAVDTDLDFAKLNERYHAYVSPKHSSITQAYLLAQLLDSRADTFFSAYYMAEPVTAPISSDIMELKHFEFLRRRGTSSDDIRLFHEVVVPDFPTIAEAINSNERSFAEFLKLLDEAEKFKKWLHETNPDVGLIQSYYQEVSKRSWVEKLPGKGIRFLVAAGVGLGASAASGPAGGLGVGAANTFFLDRLLKGWRPNRFVEGPYKRFVSGPD